MWIGYARLLLDVFWDSSYASKDEDVLWGEIMASFVGDCYLTALIFVCISIHVFRREDFIPREQTLKHQAYIP